MKIRIVLFSGIIIMFSTLSAKDTPLDSLINLIEVRFETYTDYDTFSASVVSVTNIMDGNWEPKEEYEIDKRILIRGEDTEEEIIKAIKRKKGKETDITEKVQEDQKKRKEKAEKRRMKDEGEDQDEQEQGFSVDLEDLLPFQAEKRDLYAFVLLPDTTVSDRPAYAIEATLKEDAENVFEGKYYYDKKTIDLLLVDVTPSVNPKFVKELRMKMWFDVLDNQYLILTQNWMKMYAGFLFKKVRMVIDETYTDYQIVPNTVISGESQKE